MIEERQTHFQHIFVLTMRLSSSKSKKSRENRPMGNLPSSCIENEPIKTGLLTNDAAAAGGTPTEDMHSSTLTLCPDDCIPDSSRNINGGSTTSPSRRRRSLISFLRLNTNGSTKERSLHSSTSSRTSRRTGSCTATTTTANNQRQHTVTLPKGTVLLKGCQTAEDHFNAIRKAMDGALGLEGDNGLRAMGFEFRLLPCDEHKKDVNNQQQPLDHQQPPVSDISLLRNHEEIIHLSSTSQRLLAMKKEFDHVQPSDVQSQDGSESESCSSSREKNLDDLEIFRQMGDDGLHVACNLCSHRLFHIESGKMVDEQNRKEMIADGCMYDRICELTQESAQSMMIREGDLEWVEVDSNPEQPMPLRVLVSRNRGDHETKSPLFVVCTGRGKVSAGIFTRHHLLCSGLELATGTYVDCFFSSREHIYR
jgi:hypothetical protein